MWNVSNCESQWTKPINPGNNYLAFSADDSKLACKTGNKTFVLDADSGEECNGEDTFDFYATYDHAHESNYVS